MPPLQMPSALPEPKSIKTPRRPAGVLLVALAVLPALLAAPAFAQETIEEARQNLDEIQEEKLRVKSQIDLLEAEDIEVLDALNAAAELVDRQEARVLAVRQEIRTTTAQIRQRENAQERALFEIAEIRDEASKLAVESYLNIEPPGLEVLFGADDITQGMRRLAILEVMRSNTSDLIDQVRLKEDQNAEAAEELAAGLLRVQRLEKDLQAELEVLEEQRIAQHLIKTELDIRRRQLQQEFADWAQEASALESFIRLEELREEERRRREALLKQAKEQGMLATPETAASGFGWPTAGYVASGYGYRWHPILGGNRLHMGIDLGSIMGQSVWASKSGVVIRAGWAGGYGKMVVIDHGGGFSSLYAHLQSISVGEGHLVRAGEEVGKMGSTGLSTGPHLHFEIRVNGVAQDPLQYLSG